MIKLETKTMTKAIARAKAVRPRVRVLSVAERTYSVTGSKGDTYTVKFAVAGGHKLGECDCKARGVCYHLAAAAAVNIGIQSMRQASPAPPAAQIERRVETDCRTLQKYTVVTINGWAI